MAASFRCSFVVRQGDLPVDIFDLLMQGLYSAARITVPFVVSVVVLAVLQQLLYRTVGGQTGHRWQIATGFVGVPVHEIAHALMVLLFGMKIQRIALFKPNIDDQSLGYVEYSFTPRSPIHFYGKALVGIAPLLAGMAAVSGIVWALLGHWPIWFSTEAPFNPAFWTLEPAKEMWWHFQDAGWLSWLLLWIGISVAMHCCPSKPDLVPGMEAYLGTAVLFVVGIVLAELFGISGWALNSLPDVVPHMLSVGAQMLLTVVFFSLIGTLPVAVLASMVRLARKKSPNARKKA
jgi:hypothetical protein